MAQSLEGGFLSNNKVTQYDHDPGSTAAVDIAWVDMKDYSEITISTFASALTGAGCNAFTILANSESNGSGTDATVATHAIGSAPDAVGDYLFLSVSAEMIRAVETSSTGQLRYVSASITCANAADEQVVTYIRSEPRFAKDGLTADVVA